MALFDIVRNVVQGTVKNVFESFKGDVAFQAWIGQDGKGTDLFASAVNIRAIINLDKKRRFTDTGVLVMTFATLTILDPIGDTAPNAGETREQPVDPRDILTLPDGSTAPVVQAGGPILDPLTSRSIMNEVILGSAIIR